MLWGEMCNDVIVEIMDHAEFMKDVLSMSSVCKMMRSALYESIRRANIFLVQPRRTFIDYGRCHICDATISDSHCIIYAHDEHPRRISIHCERWFCAKASLRHFFDDVVRMGIHPFNRISHKGSVWIPRSDGSFSAGLLCARSPMRYMAGSAYVKAIFEPDGYESCDRAPIITRECTATKYVRISDLPVEVPIKEDHMFSCMLVKTS